MAASSLSRAGSFFLYKTKEQPTMYSQQRPPPVCALRKGALIVVRVLAAA
ncbi:hypothetical protein [Candidatus Electronema sp. JC]